MAETVKIVKHAEGALVELRVRPKAGRTAIGDVHEGRLRVFVSAAPEKGRANAAVVKLMAKKLGVAAGSLEVVRGRTGRDKTLLVRGLTPDQIAALLT